MEPVNPMELRVSVIDPINPAVERVKLLLFAPFDVGRWFIVGFCAWLAQIARYNGGGGGGSHGEGAPSPVERLQEAKDFVLTNLVWVVPLTVVLLVLAISIILLLVWLSSRGRFMFLDCVARNVAHVRDPWHRFRSHAASLFAFRIAVGFITFAILSAIMAAGGALYWAASMSVFSVASIVGLVVIGLLALIAMILFAIVGLFTTDFVVPIMYLNTVNCTQGWRILLDVLSWNLGRFILYVLFQVLLRIVIAALIMGVTCMTCGCACCFFAIPYIGTVVLLPIFAFERSYSACYLAQYGPQFNVFAPPTAPATGSQQPI